jgi:Zn-dependent protease/CBS domain-containing protein
MRPPIDAVRDSAAMRDVAMSGNDDMGVGNRRLRSRADRHTLSHVIPSLRPLSGVDVHSRPRHTRWAWRAGRLIGIDVYVHVTFPLLFGWVAFRARAGGASGRAILAALALTLAVFLIVVLHECGHALIARRFGIRTRDITLLPIGGTARLERMPRPPRQELLIAIAGPAVNLVLAAILYAGSQLFGVGVLRELSRPAIAITPASAAAQLIAINVGMAAFNLIPAFPMDGGRVLRAILAMRSRDYARATGAAARVGRAFAVVFAVVGILLLESPTFALVAAFVWIAATSEALAVRRSAALEHVPLARVMITDFRTLAPNDNLARAATLAIEGFQEDFPIADRGTLVGMLTRRDLLRGLVEHGTDAFVGDVMRRGVPTVSIDTRADSAVEQLAASGGATMPVLRGQELVGVLTADNVAEFLSVRAALGDG